MKQLISVLLLITLLTGCSWFSYYDNLQECDELLMRSKAQLKQSIVLLDSLVAVTDSLNFELIKHQHGSNRNPFNLYTDSLELELKKCQQ